MSANDIIAMLRARFPAPEWETACEVAQSTGGMAGRRLDFMAINTWPSKGRRVIGVEVKVDRGDWLRELDQPKKREPFERCCNEFWFACASGVAKKDEVPKGLGLMEPRGGKLVRVVRAQYRSDRELSKQMWYAVLRAVGAEKNALRQDHDLFAHVRGRALSYDDLRSLAFRILDRGGARQRSDADERARRKRLDDDANRRAWMASWEEVVAKVCELARADGVALPAYRAFTSPQAARSLAEWIDGKRSILDAQDAARRLVQLVDDHVRPAVGRMD